MDVKEFLKPDWRKILITVLSFILITVLTFLFWSEGTPGVSITHKAGFPLPYFSITTSGMLLPPPTRSFNPIGLFIDILFYYVVSCFIVWIYNKVTRKRKIEV